MDLPSEPVLRRCHASLKRGEYKRVPRPLRFPPAGYYFGCRGCGFVIMVRTKFLNDQLGVAVDERGGKLISLARVECDRCGYRFTIEGGSYVDGHA